MGAIAEQLPPLDVQVAVWDEALILLELIRRRKDRKNLMPMCLRPSAWQRRSQMRK